MIHHSRRKNTVDKEPTHVPGEVPHSEDVVHIQGMLIIQPSGDTSGSTSSLPPCWGTHSAKRHHTSAEDKDNQFTFTYVRYKQAL